MRAASPWRRGGFTLIELMVVVAIIGILAAVAIPAFVDYIRTSKQTEVSENLDRCYKGVIDYFDRPTADRTGSTISHYMPPNLPTPFGPAYAGGGACVPINLNGETGFVPSAVYDVGAMGEILKDMKWVITEAILACYYYSSTRPAGSPVVGDQFWCEAWTDIDDDDMVAHFHKQANYTTQTSSFQAGTVWHNDVTDEF